LDVFDAGESGSEVLNSSGEAKMHLNRIASGYANQKRLSVETWMEAKNNEILIVKVKGFGVGGVVCE
jgi:hypothetical protein